MNKKKKIYEVEGNESINDCLERIKKDGYVPVKRTEKPIFQEKNENGQVSYELAGRKIIFRKIEINSKVVKRIRRTEPIYLREMDKCTK